MSVGLFVEMYYNPRQVLLNGSTAHFCNGSPERLQNKKGPHIARYKQTRRKKPQNVTSQSTHSILKGRSYRRKCNQCQREIIDLLMSRTSSLPISARSEQFKGACLDPGAEQFVIGKMQAKACCELTGIKMKRRPSMKALRFGCGVYNSVGTVPTQVPTRDGSFPFLDIDVVQASIPMPVGPDLLD